MPNIFTYINYRKFLKDSFQERKAETPHFTYRYLAEQAGFNSAGFFTNIIQGKRNISLEMAGNFARVFNLNKKEAGYLELLVLSDQAKTQSEKKYYLQQAICERNTKFKAKELNIDEFYDKWYYSAVRELAILLPNPEDCKTLAKSVSPSITPAQAKKSLKLLTTLGLLVKGPDGTYTQADPFITSGRSVNAAMLANYHMQMAELAKHAIDKYPKDKRNISTLTLGLSPASYAKIVEKLRDFRKELLEITSAEKNPENAYHINFHLFPISKKRG